MKKIQFILAGLLVALMHISTSMAEDTDIYSGLGAGAGTPNIMIIIDNASNSNAQMTACTYLDGTTPTGSNQGSKSLDNYMCALDNLANGLSTKADGSALVNLGITTQAGVYLRLTPVNDAVYSGIYPHTAAQTNRQVLSKAIRELTSVSGLATQGTSFQETWAYYTGGNGGSTNVGIKSGTAYTGTNATTGCQKNFAIFISGVTNSAHANTDGNELPKLTASIDNAIASSAITATEGAGLKVKIGGNSEESPWAVEWARFMHGVDINTTTEGTGVQSITTYSVAAGSPVYPAAMGSMERYIRNTAQYGGGKYFAATSYSAIYQSILRILNEVQAVNSVFSASSLPVSVNAQGTFLNQIYMGMFRPDETGSPRWVGNMKQYQFVATRNATTNEIELFLGDSLGNPAISAGGTGFLAPDAVSYWTCGGNPSVRACSPVAEPTAGYWANDSKGVGTAYDLPDGEYVEKGGAAQIVRLANLTADYTTTAGSTTNPRKIYTYCPSGSSCNATLSNSANAFSTANVNIASNAFGASSSLVVSSIVRTGTTALVTTATTHNYVNAASVTISGADQPEYNVTQAINFTNPNSANTFTITGLPDYPSTPSTGTYTAGVHNSTPQTITGVSVTTATTANAIGCASGSIPNINCVQVTVTLPNHGYSNGNTVVISGVSPAQYSGVFTIANALTNTFTYNVSVTPSSPSQNAYSIALPPPTAKTFTAITKSGSTFTVSSSAHGFLAGQLVTISGCSTAAYNATFTVATPVNTGSFVITGPSGNPATCSGSVVLNNPSINILVGNISRASANASVASATAASAVTHNASYNLSYVSGANTNEAAYAPKPGSRSVVATCASGTSCTTFTFPLTTPFSTTLTTSSPTAALQTSSVSIVAGKITRSNSGTTATVTGVANTFISGQFIDIGVSGSAVGTESAYLSPAAGWQISCPLSCSTAFTFGPVTLSPVTPATTASTIRAYQGSTPPDKNSLINWVRGEDNVGDEKSLCPPGTTAGTANCPSTRVTVRPSIHGDVLHSRPVALNYGGTTGVVVYYGGNDGVYRAVNGNQVNPTGSSLPVPGSELWGFIPNEFFGKLNRQRSNSPLLSLPSTPNGIVPNPEKKDYFADGSTSVYQLLNADGTTNKAYIYLTMRRGDDLIYALDVSVPTNPKFLWKLDPTGLTTPSGFTASTDFAELGQTWSNPKVNLIRGYANPVMIFGAGYSTTQDAVPATADTAGRGIYIVDAVTGALVWRASYGTSSACSGTTTKAACTVSGMNYSIPSDITLMDRDSDGYIDRLYAADMGGNVWRVDLQPSGSTINNTPDFWRVNQVASLGGGGVPLRKFFFPPDVIPTNDFDLIIATSGDREHPLSSISTRDRIYVLKDLAIGNDGSGQATINNSDLFDGTTTLYSAATGTNKGYFKDFLAGEKGVNAPLTVAGFTYFGTNQPTASNSCTANLGIAKGYRLDPFTGAVNFIVFDGGGLPPSPVAGVVNLIVQGESTESSVPFCIGCGGARADAPISASGGASGGPSGCNTPLGACNPPISVPSSRTRTYWYQEID